MVRIDLAVDQPYQRLGGLPGGRQQTALQVQAFVVKAQPFQRAADAGHPGGGLALLAVQFLDQLADQLVVEHPGLLVGQQGAGRLRLAV
ncbi:hypothetical protein [Deinococcus sp. UYEF24]